MNIKKISIPTPFGELTAEIGMDPDYPTIYTYLKREDGAEIDLVAVEADQFNKMIKAYVYEDTTRDDYTESYLWTKEELNIDYN